MSAMGDVAMTVPVLSQLLEQHPEIRITVVSRIQFEPLFSGLPRTQFLEADVKGKHKGLRGLLRLAQTASRLDVDLVADLHNVLRSKTLVAYFRLKGVRCMVMDKGRAEKRALIEAQGAPKTTLKTTHQRYADVFSKAGVQIDLTTKATYPKAELSPRLHNVFGTGIRKAIGIAPFAAHSGKMYPLAQTEQLVLELAKDPNYLVLLFGGGEKETAWLSKLASMSEQIENIAGQVTFTEELTLISNLDLMVSMDSGNGHLAAMYDVPVLTLWGVTHPCLGFAPFGQTKQAQLLPDLEKYPSIPTSVYGNKVPEGYQQVMASINVSTVIEKVRSLV